MSTRMIDKVRGSVESLWIENRSAVAHLRRAYQEGRWDAATPAERWRTRRGFRIRQARIRELVRWLASHDRTATSGLPEEHR